jgi:hypothetical protein
MYQLLDMSRNGFCLLAMLALLVLLTAGPSAVAEEPGPDVTLVSGSPAFSIEDANRSEVNYSAYDHIYGQSAHISVITAQLYLDGRPYNMSGIQVTFTSDNDSVAVLEPLNRTRPSDERGQAKILLISNNTVGIVNITASANPTGFTIRDSCTVRVVGWGTVSGVVTDKNKNGVPYAKVTLWRWSESGNQTMLVTGDNPQLTNDGSTAAIGTYTFVYVPQGIYNVTAEKDGHVYYAIVYMTVGTYTANIAFPDYVYLAPITPTPAAPTATPAAASPTPAATPAPTPAPGALAALAMIGLACLAAWRKP